MSLIVRMLTVAAIAIAETCVLLLSIITCAGYGQPPTACDVLII